jgi:hypothetical protein
MTTISEDKRKPRINSAVMATASEKVAPLLNPVPYR